MRMLGAAVNPQLFKLVGRERAFLRHHAFHGFFDHALGEFTFKNLVSRAFFDATRITGMPVICFVGALFAGQFYFFGIDDHDMVAGIDMRGEHGFVLATQQHRDFGCQTAEHNAFSIDDPPAFGNV